MGLMEEITDQDLAKMTLDWTTTENLTALAERLGQRRGDIARLELELETRNGQLNMVLFRLAEVLGYAPDENGVIDVDLHDLLNEIESEFSEED